MPKTSLQKDQLSASTEVLAIIAGVLWTIFVIVFVGNQFAKDLSLAAQEQGGVAIRPLEENGSEAKRKRAARRLAGLAEDPRPEEIKFGFQRVGQKEKPFGRVESIFRFRREVWVEGIEWERADQEETLSFAGLLIPSITEASDKSAEEAFNVVQVERRGSYLVIRGWRPEAVVIVAGGTAEEATYRAMLGNDLDEAGRAAIEESKSAGFLFGRPISAGHRIMFLAGKAASRFS